MATQADLNSWINQLQEYKAKADAAITALQAEVDALKAAAPPTLDFSALENAISALTGDTVVHPAAPAPETAPTAPAPADPPAAPAGS